MSSAIDVAYNRLIDQLIDVGREITAYRQRFASGDVHRWHQDLEPILEQHRAVTARLREIGALRATS